MKIAVVFSSIPTDGGAFSYEQNLEQLMDSISKENGHTLVKVYPSAKLKTPSKSGHGLTYETSVTYKFGLLAKIHTWLLRTQPGRLILNLFGIDVIQVERKLIKLGADLVYFASPNPLALGIFQLPIATTVWDLGHRDVPEFPEVSAKGRWENRELYFSESVPKSIFVCSDSSATKNQLERFYGLSPSRGFAVGLLPRKRECSCDALDHDIPLGPYILYPAQKWRHKNHALLLAAVKELVDDGSDIKLVLTGGDKGQGMQLTSLSANLGIEKSVIDLGFVSDHLLTHLMISAASVVMPSFLGPTNLPPLEAILLGKPVVVSDIHNFDNLPENAPIQFVDPNSPSEWALAINKSMLYPRFDSSQFQEDLELSSRKALSDALRLATSRLQQAGA
jgi:glycosyltransferase involved in cell wall biosynthesis